MSDNPLRLWDYGGRTLADGLFRMHDEVGFSLTDSLIECRKRGWTPCLDQFRADAIRAGWKRERAQQVIDAAIADAAGI